MNFHRGAMPRSPSLHAAPAQGASETDQDADFLEWEKHAQAGSSGDATGDETGCEAQHPSPTGLRQTLRTLTASPPFRAVVLVAIVLNSIVLGVETYPLARARYGDVLHAIDVAFLLFFVAELSLRIAAEGRSFFRGKWNVFDLTIVLISLLPFLGNLSALRALRILRALRLLTAVPVFQKILTGISLAFRNSFPVAIVLAIIMYIYGVMSNKLFGEIDPMHFGDLDSSLMTLFQIITLDAWTEIIRPIVAVHWYAGIFFVSFVLIAVFILLSIVIGIASDAMSSANERPTNEDLLNEIRKLQR